MTSKKKIKIMRGFLKDLLHSNSNCTNKSQVRHGIQCINMENQKAVHLSPKEKEEEKGGRRGEERESEGKKVKVGEWARKRRSKKETGKEEREGKGERREWGRRDGKREEKTREEGGKGRRGEKRK